MNRDNKLLWETYHNAEQFDLPINDTKKPVDSAPKKTEPEVRTYTVRCTPDALDKLELFFRWINSTAGGHSGTAALSIDGDGRPRFTVKRKGGELHDDPDKKECANSKPTPEYHISID